MFVALYEVDEMRVLLAQNRWAILGRENLIKLEGDVRLKLNDLC
ncbi:MAG: hypothetical protein QXT06_00850 [Candidatus Bathyarchaeia archaeon]